MIEDNNIGYWDFVEKYYPNYYSCSDILLSDILTRKLHNEEISKEDEEMIKGWDVKKALLELDCKIMCKAIESYYNDGTNFAL